MNILSKRLKLLKQRRQQEEAVVKNLTYENPNKQKSLLVFPNATDKAEDIVAALQLKPYKAVFLNLGNAENFEDKFLPRLTQLFSRGIAVAALDADALIIDGGLPSGVMELMGKGVSDRGNKSILIGMAPAYKVSFQEDVVSSTSLETNHSHVILTERGNWETDPTISQVVSLLINRPGVVGERIVERKVPALAIVTGGQETTKELVLLAVRQKLTVIIVEGSSGLADEIAAASQKKDTPPEDPSLAEIIADGKLFFHALSQPANEMESLIAARLGTDKVLMQAWEVFADYNLNANKQQWKFDKLQQAIIFIGVIGTALAIIHEVVKSDEDQPPFLEFTSMVTYAILIIIPITLTILVTIANRFKQGNKWLLLRAAAEAIKREIFRYRTRTNDYYTNPEQQLTKKIEDITTRTMRTEVNSSYLIPYNKEMGFPPDTYGAQGGDDGFSILSPDRYVAVRLGDQLNYFRKRSVTLGKQLSALSISIFIVGGIGTFLAAINQPVWIALTTTIVAALGTYLGYRQTEHLLTKYNQTATNLSNVQAWWNALLPQQRLLQENINTLVDHTEQVLQVELDGWIQQMQNALAELRKNQETKAEKNENDAPETQLAPTNGETENLPETRAEQVVKENGKVTPPIASGSAENSPSGISVSEPAKNADIKPKAPDERLLLVKD